jgi:hypothetical protein
MLHSIIKQQGFKMLIRHGAAIWSEDMPCNAEKLLHSCRGCWDMDIGTQQQLCAVLDVCNCVSCRMSEDGGRYEVMRYSSR